MAQNGQLSRIAGRLAAACMAGASLFAGPARAQLAITEMMSKSANTFRQTSVTNDTDYFEVTNFGTQILDMGGYMFADSKDSKQLRRPLVPNVDPPLFIRGGESVIFVRTRQPGELDEAAVRAWWGRCLDSGVQVRFYPTPGFSSFGDRLSIYGPDGSLVDRVDFGAATRGRSFVYDPQTGDFTALSTLGEGGACQAETTDDIGSPGVTTGPVPLRIVQQPESISPCVGVDAKFEVIVAGVPRPREFRWFFKDIRIKGENESTLVLTNVSAAQEGAYHVSIANSFASLVSSKATLTLNTNPSAPSILAPPTDSTVATNRTARFAISVCAFPVARYQWASNGVPMEGATNRTLFVPNCTLEMSGSEFCVHAENELGSLSACAKLYVATKPELRFTEVHSYPIGGTNCPAHHDWFEVTNYATNSVDLLGYRISDKFTLAGAIVIEKSTILQPLESAVFVKNPAVGPFVDWWGADQLPPGVKLIPYGGMSLSKSGDSLYIWNATAEDPKEVIHSISYATAASGVSQRFDSDDARFGAQSVPGEFGAFRAVECGDIGSPGYTTNPPPRIVGIVQDAEGTHLRWRAVEGNRYQLEYCVQSQGGSWTLVGTAKATNSLMTLVDPGSKDASARMRFYRLLEMTR